MKRSTHRIATGSWRDLRMGPSSFAEGNRAPSTRDGAIGRDGDSSGRSRRGLDAIV
jgi:hypothetical protein